MKKQPTELNNETPQWFKDWHDKEFWHFCYDVRSRLSRLEKFYWIILPLLIGAILAQRFL